MLLIVYLAIGVITFCVNCAIVLSINEQITIKEIIGSLPIVLFGWFSPFILLYKAYGEYGDRKIKKD